MNSTRHHDTQHDIQPDNQLPTMVQAVTMTTSAAQKGEIKAWEEQQVVACEHTLCLQQALANRAVAEKSMCEGV